VFLRCSGNINSSGDLATPCVDPEVCERHNRLLVQQTPVARVAAEAEDLLATIAGERDGVPPVHGVRTP
jgi:hypothetical protein